MNDVVSSIHMPYGLYGRVLMHLSCDLGLGNLPGVECHSHFKSGVHIITSMGITYLLTDAIGKLLLPKPGVSLKSPAAQHRGI